MSKRPDLEIFDRTVSGQVDPARMERMTAKQTPGSSQATAPEAVLEKRHAGVLGTSGRKSAGRWQQRRHPPLVHGQERGQQTAHDPLFLAPRKARKSRVSSISRAPYSARPAAGLACTTRSTAARLLRSLHLR